MIISIINSSIAINAMDFCILRSITSFFLYQHHNQKHQHCYIQDDISIIIIIWNQKHQHDQQQYDQNCNNIMFPFCQDCTLVANLFFKRIMFKIILPEDYVQTNIPPDDYFQNYSFSRIYSKIILPDDYIQKLFFQRIIFNIILPDEYVIILHDNITLITNAVHCHFLFLLNIPLNFEYCFEAHEFFSDKIPSENDWKSRRDDNSSSSRSPESNITGASLLHPVHLRWGKAWGSN